MLREAKRKGKLKAMGFARHKRVVALTFLACVLTGDVSAQEGKTYFYVVNPGAYILEKLEGRGIFLISSGPGDNILRIVFPAEMTASQVKRELKTEFPGLQIVENVDDPRAR